MLVEIAMSVLLFLTSLRLSKTLPSKNEESNETIDKEKEGGVGPMTTDLSSAEPQATVVDDSDGVVTTMPVDYSEAVEIADLSLSPS